MAPLCGGPLPIYTTTGDVPDFNLAVVFKRLYQLAIRESRLVLGPIPQNLWGWSTLDRPAYVDRCPSRRWVMNRATGRIGSYLDDCDSTLCSRCSPRRSENTLLWACRVFRKSRWIWTAVVPYEKAIVERVKQRRSRLASKTGIPIGMLWVHRIDEGTLHFYASEELAGRDAPVEWTLMTPQESLGQLTSQTLALPGAKERRFGGSWAMPPRKSPPKRMFDLGRNHPEDLMDLAEIAAAKELRRQHGLRPSELKPEEIEEIWLPLTKKAVGEQWAIRNAERSSDI